MDKKFDHLRQAIEEHRKAGVMTDQWLLPQFFKLTKGTEVHLVATDTFIGKSKEQYNAAWLSRELIQNFVDHNPEDQGTLNGVEITMEDIPTPADAKPQEGKDKRQFKRITISGNWKFENPTGVISPHSEKPEDTETAGGNGIGLKQAALRMLRDFDTNKFQINGEGWQVEYDMIKKDDVNQTIEENLPQMEAARARHDWLVADLSKTKNKGKNSYVIETDNPELIAALAELPNLGVSRDNKYLQDLDLDVQTGDKQFIAVKWLKPDEQGRLFLNGQVMNYEKNGDTAEDYWCGPEGLSVSMKGVKYKMSVDRPPVSRFQFDQYLDTFTKKLSIEQLTDQLQKSYSLWRNVFYPSYARPGFMVMVDKLVKELQSRKDYKPEQFKILFPEKLLANDVKLEEKDLARLREDGYLVCDEIFAKIGMEKASSLLTSSEMLVREKRPDNPSRKLEQMAEDTGLQVYFEDFGDIDTGKFIAKIEQFAKKYGATIKVTSEGIKITIPQGINTETLYAQIPYPKKNRDQQLLFELRSLINHGIANDLFGEHTHTSNDDLITTYKSSPTIACGEVEQTLIIRNNRVRPKQYTNDKLPLEATFIFGDNLTGDKVNKILAIINESTEQPAGEAQQPDAILPARKARFNRIPQADTERIARAISATSYEPLPHEKPNWFRRALVVLGIGAVGALGAYEASKVPDKAPIAGAKIPGETPPSEAREKHKQELLIAQIKKQKESADKFEKFKKQHPDAFVGPAGLGKTDIAAVKNNTAAVEPEIGEEEELGPEQGDHIEDFEPLAEMTPKQAEQFKMLSSYLELT
ncbi:MAG: hypothetical protein ACD_72C00532G0005, partial [uncultured bacterium]